MRWSDVNLHPAPRVLRQFALAWLLVLGALGAHRWLVRGDLTVGRTLVVLAVTLGGLGLIRPSAIRWLFAACTVAAYPLGWVVSQVVLAIMFYGIITPVAILMRTRGRDLLGRKSRPSRESYWTPKSRPTDMSRYFRQY